MLSKLKEKIKHNLPVMVIPSIIVLFIVVYLFNRIFIVIHGGEAGVMYYLFFGGTVVDKVYGEGFYLNWPWDTMHRYNVRVQQIPHEFDVLSKNGLKIHLYISIRYYPEYKLLGVLHQKVGPKYADVVVVPEIEQVLRLIIGQMDAEEVYTTGRSIIEKSLNDATEQIAQRFIIVDNVIIKKLSLPEQVEKAIQDKIEEKHIADSHIYKIEKQKKEAERKRIEANMMKEYNETVNSSITDKILKWEGLHVTLELAKSPNSKVVIVGNGKEGFPVIGNFVLNEPDEKTKPLDEKPKIALEEPKENVEKKVEPKKSPGKTKSKK
ncbi:MAG: prohibitin family protein [Desulfobacterales bacterium]|nr:prohibitin family protein [Desulfobacterales bacterium]MBF0395447.1 prohibitin family protein [Desulfobacterales bacterium]